MLTKNPVTWGKKLREKATRERAPMFCIAFDDSPTGKSAESIYYIGTGDPLLMKELKSLLFRHLKLDGAKTPALAEDGE